VIQHITKYKTENGKTRKVPAKAGNKNTMETNPVVDNNSKPDTLPSAPAK